MLNMMFIIILMRWLKKLDLSICDGKDITIGYPMDISRDNLDSYYKNSGFYNDICYTYKKKME